MSSSLLFPSWDSIMSLKMKGSKQINNTRQHDHYTDFQITAKLYTLHNRHLLGIDENNEHEEEDEEGVGLLEVDVPQSLSDLRKTVARKQTAQLQR